MKAVKLFWNLATTCAVFLATIAPAVQATAQAQPSAGAKTVLLIHGAWADGSSWAKVIPLLEAKGLHVVAVQIPLTSLADDVAATQRAIALEDGPVLLVGHSYSGAVITEAGNDPKVAGLVYVAAVAPDQGESTFSLITSVATPIPIGSQRSGHWRICAGSPAMRESSSSRNVPSPSSNTKCGRAYGAIPSARPAATACGQ